MSVWETSKQSRLVYLIGSNQSICVCVCVCAFVLLCACLLKTRVTHIVCVCVFKPVKSEHHAVPGFQNTVSQLSDSFIQTEDESIGAVSQRLTLLVSDSERSSAADLKQIDLAVGQKINLQLFLIITWAIIKAKIKKEKFYFTFQLLQCEDLLLFFFFYITAKCLLIWGCWWDKTRHLQRSSWALGNCDEHFLWFK